MHVKKLHYIKNNQLGRFTFMEEPACLKKIKYSGNCFNGMFILFYLVWDCKFWPNASKVASEFIKICYYLGYLCWFPIFI